MRKLKKEYNQTEDRHQESQESLGKAIHQNQGHNVKKEALGPNTKQSK